LSVVEFLTGSTIKNFGVIKTGLYNNLLNLTGFGVSIVLTRIYVICHSESFAALEDKLREESHARNRPKSYAKARCFAALSMTV